MKRLGLSKVLQALLLGSLVLAAAGCHKNQNAQNSGAQNPIDPARKPAGESG